MFFWSLVTICLRTPPNKTKNQENILFLVILICDYDFQFVGGSKQLVAVGNVRSLFPPFSTTKRYVVLCLGDALGFKVKGSGCRIPILEL